MKREQRIQSICVLWRNAEAAIGRPEPLSAEECASIEEGIDGERRAELARLGVWDLDENPPEVEPAYADKMREAIEVDAYMLRQNLVKELIQLDASEAAAALITELPEEDRAAFWESLVEDLTVHGDFNAARATADAHFPNDAQKRLSLRMVVYRRDPKPEELSQLRAIADRTVDESANFPPAAVAAFLEIWKLSSDPADLEVARALCRGIKTGLRLMAYQNIASRTGLVSDFLIAFRYATRFTSRQTRAEAANRMFGQVWVSRKCDAEPDVGRLVCKGTSPLSREDTERLLDELKQLSPLWAAVLRKKLEDHDLL